ncbi:hypothetical protein U9M48_006026 [Paspalum notatum var. saurae]|uniref:Cytochrome P450 n=1 Tax=Paspalum notatum var. saurae TaxID=547442 RepID=A0AAQ3PYW6_PASNO
MVSHMWRAMFSTELDEVSSQEVHDCVREATALVAAPNVSDFFPVLAPADLQGMRRRMARLITRSYKLMDSQIQRRIRVREMNDEASTRKNDLLDAMLDMSEKERDNGRATVSRDLMKAFFTDLFVGASDTTSTTIEWALAELLQNPQTMRKLQEELRLVLGARTQVEDSDIDNLPYLQAVIKEALRLHSVVPLLLYKAYDTVELHGYTIPKGSSVLVNVWAIHQNAEVWCEPQKFIPERFLQKEISFSDRNLEFFPFASGRHVCLGLPLANRMLHLILGSLLHRFDWTLGEDDARRGVGNLLDMSNLPHRSLARLAERHGPLMTVRLCSTVIFVASSPSTAREVLQRHNATLSGRAPLDSWRGANHVANSIFVLQQGHKWRALRRLGSEQLFSPKRLELLEPLRRDVVQGLLRDVSEQADSGVPVSVGRAAFTAMVSHMWRAMFSTELDELSPQELHDYVREATALLAAPNVSDFFPVLAPADLQGVRHRMARLFATSYQLMDSQIQRRIRARGVNEASTRKNDLLDAMLDMSEKDSKEQDSGRVTVTRDLMRAFFTDLFVGAIDTTSSTIEWAFAELLQNPQIMRKLQEELRSVLGSRTQVEDPDIDNLPYLQAVVKETLRLHSVAPLLSYKAYDTVELHGYTIPKGSSVIVNVWGIHRNAEVWAEPQKFIPERFLRKEISFSDKNFEFFPFSSGRHVCPGFPLANRMLPLILGSLLHRFDWTLGDDDARRGGLDMTEKFGLVLSMATPIHAIAKKR